MTDVYSVPFWSSKFYDHKARWLNYFTQIRAVAKAISIERGNSSFSVLEIGPSHGLVTEYLRKFGVSVKTLDRKKEYNPDYLGSVTSIPCHDNTFDFVLASEILEHLTFEEYKKALTEIFRVTRKYAFITVPDVRHTLIDLYIKLPLLPSLAFSLRFPTRKQMPKLPIGAHQWEIGRPGMSAKKVSAEMKNTGFIVIDEFVNRDTPRNHCFYLKKTVKNS